MVGPDSAAAELGQDLEHLVGEPAHVEDVGLVRGLGRRRGLEIDAGELRLWISSLERDHSCMVAVPRPARASIQDSLSDT